MLPTKFQVNWPFSSGEVKKKDFQESSHGYHLGFTIGTIVAIFDLQVSPMLPTKFQVNWPFGLAEKAKNRFSIWQPGWPAWISDQNDFASYQVSSQLAFWFRKRSKKYIFKLLDF